MHFLLIFFIVFLEQAFPSNPYWHDFSDDPWAMVMGPTPHNSGDQPAAVGIGALVELGDEEYHGAGGRSIAHGPVIGTMMKIPSVLDLPYVGEANLQDYGPVVGSKKLERHGKLTEIGENKSSTHVKSFAYNQVYNQQEVVQSPHSDLQPSKDASLSSTPLPTKEKGAMITVKLNNKSMDSSPIVIINLMPSSTYSFYPPLYGHALSAAAWRLERRSCALSPSSVKYPKRYNYPYGYYGGYAPYNSYGYPCYDEDEDEYY